MNQWAHSQGLYARYRLVTPMLRLATLGLLISSGLTTHSLYAQSMEVLVQEGDVLSDGSTIFAIEEIGVGDGGAWAARVFTQDASGIGSALLIDGDIAMRSGDPVGSAGRCCLAGVNHVEFDPMGNPLILVRMTDAPFMQGAGILRGTDFVLERDDPVIAPQAPAGTFYGEIEGFRQIAQDRLLVSAKIYVFAGGYQRPALIELELDAAGNRVAEVIRWQAGDLCPDVQLEIFQFPINFKNFATNVTGQLAWTAFLAGNLYGAFVEDSLVALAGQPSPWTDWDWYNATMGVALNDSGSWALHSRLLKNGNRGGSGLVRDQIPYIRDGDVLPDLQSMALENVGANAPIYLTNSGDLIWYGSWNDAADVTRSGLFLNRNLLVGDAATVIEGQTVQSIKSSWRGGRISPNGRELLVPLYGLGTSGDTLVRVILAIGEVYCDAVPNSTGRAARIAAMGSLSVADNDLRLRCDDLPLQQFGLFFLSQTPTNIPQAGGSVGTLCVGGAVGRFTGLLQSSGDIGSIAIDVDLQNIPQPMGVGSVLPGETWYFSCWYRDSGQTSNFSSAVSVQFQ